jgi:hypothetical protein
VPLQLLTAVIACPGRPGWTCGAEFEGVWPEPDDLAEENPADESQLCPECGHYFPASWPGFSFRREA